MKSIPVTEGMIEGGGLQGVSWSTTTLLVEGREGGKGQCWCLLEQCAGSCQFLLLCGAARTNISAATRLRQTVAWVNLAGAPLSSYRFVFMLGPCEGDQPNTSNVIDGTRTLYCIPWTPQLYWITCNSAQSGCVGGC